MRKFSGVLLAVTMLAPLGLIGSAAGAAAAKPTCKTISGTASVSPALPALTNKTKLVKPTLTVKGAKLAGCTGGGVTSATVGAKLKWGLPANCTTLVAGKTANIAGTVTFVWNTKASSTATVTLHSKDPKATTHLTLAGSITTGLFKGSKLSIVIGFTPLNGGCTTAGLSKASFKQVSALTIK
jgi:hypothetical protein